MKLYFVSFITIPLKYKICSNSAAVSDNLKVLRISAVFIIGQFNIQSQEMFTFFPNFRLLIGRFFFRAFGPSPMRDSRRRSKKQNVLRAEWAQEQKNRKKTKFY